MSIFTHLLVGTNDLDAARAFYDASLGALGIENLHPDAPDAGVYGRGAPEFIVVKPINGEPACHANGGTIGFAAATPADVRAFHAAGVAAGGTDEGAPGPRDFAPGAYGAYLRDPCGNKIGAFTFAEDK
jgi:catechol 2,3-dioxygenase-like lactoylglutathione lyase family enzyme